MKPNEWYYGLAVLLTTHWIADFVCQPHKIASTKSKSVYALTVHVFSYTFFLAIAVAVMNGSIGKTTTLLTLFILISHFITDFITSKITASLWKKEEWHNFFVVIGFDQLLHQLAILLVAGIIYRK